MGNDTGQEAIDRYLYSSAKKEAIKKFMKGILIPFFIFLLTGGFYALPGILMIVDGEVGIGIIASIVPVVGAGIGIWLIITKLRELIEWQSRHQPVQKPIDHTVKSILH